MKVVRTQSKGMVTIPAEYREKLGIDENSLMQVKLVSGGVLFTKLNYGVETGNLWLDKKIKTWLKEDKLDTKTAKKLQKLLK